MAFPVNPTNGEQTTQNGIVYTYNSALGVWSVLTNTPGDFGANNITATNAVAGGTVTATGNVGGANIVATNSISGSTVTAVGNISGSYFIGNGSQLTGLPDAYSNAKVSAYLPTYTGNLAALTGNVTTTANISGAYVLGNGSQLTGIDATGIQNGTSNVRVLANSDVVLGVAGTANVAVFGTSGVSVTGNITGSYLLGNGSQLTGLPAAYTNANVAAYLPTYTGNLAGGNLSISGLSTLTGNVTSSHILPTSTGNFDLGSTAQRWRNIYTNDLNLNNGIGDWTIVEGADDLFLYNNLRNKVYKFALVEVDPEEATPKILKD